MNLKYNTEEERRAARRASYKKWLNKNRDYNREYSKEWNKKWSKTRKQALMRARITPDKEEILKVFINKIEVQKGMCDDLQAFELINIFSDIFSGDFCRKYNDIEDELSYMYLTLKSTLELPIIEGCEFITEKHCYSCKETKDVTQFSVDKRSKDGYSFRCKSCKNKYQMEYFEKNPDKRDLYRKKKEEI